jgi:hypothetical protein
MEAILNNAAERSIAFRKQIQNRSVAPSPEAIKALKNFEFPFPEESTPDEKVINILDKFEARCLLLSLQIGLILHGIKMPVYLQVRR